jgi:hypothetical protein
MVTQDYFDALPRQVRDHLACRIVSELVPVTQKHDIEGPVMDVERPAEFLKFSAPERQARQLTGGKEALCETAQ